METFGHLLSAPARPDASSAKRARMRGRVHLAQLVDGDQRVHLRGRYRRMPEQLLYYADIGTAVEQVGGEGMPQYVRRPFGQPGPARGRA